ncbi:Uncharacterised protein [Campylobacter hyointestinalis subsp. hyointestinalis]|uniref:Uncharacterized protein n=1 Tax=Campylobacter hyointestinalis subsp. hyointestinalis TaxID=91352 RepID=A0A9W5AT05_CAMHY|nr:hypothetical protein [Campylobacter hyointestinalis]CUU81837.1 Uncharacterised protein [Campylobacter hyointestinalis subsp. hyointestinalis]
MKLKETANKEYHNTNLKESNPKSLDISFKNIIDDCEFGLPTSSSDNINDKSKVQKIVKTLMYIREKKPHELIQTNKTQSIGGCEKCDIDKWQWSNDKIKHFLAKFTSQVFIIRAGDSRIFGTIDKNCFYIHAIEYKLGDIYQHS